MNRSSTQVDLGTFAPAPIPRPKSALNLRVRKEISRVKSLANAVTASGSNQTLILEDLTSKQLMLSHDTELQVEKTMEGRESEMRDIVDARQRKYNQRRLVSDRKEDTLSKMTIELGALEAFRAKMERASKVEDLEQLRLDEVRDELRIAELSMEEAVGYTDSLHMMRARLLHDITKRRKLQGELDRHLNEAKRELNVVMTHQRVLLASEIDANEKRDKLDAHLVSRRGVQAAQLAKRRATAESLATGGGPGGRDLVAEHAAAVAARQKRMASAQAQQSAIRWTLDTLNENMGKIHEGGGGGGGGVNAAAPAAPAHRAPPAPGGGGGGAAPAQLKRGTSASGSRVVGGRVVAMPFAALDEVKSFTGEVAPAEVRKAKEGPFARYMQRIYAKTGISDGPSVLRKLHHWVRTEKTAQAQSANATHRYETLRREEQIVSAELDRLRRLVLLEADHHGAAEGHKGGAPKAMQWETHAGEDASVPPSPSKLGGGGGGIDEHLEAVASASKRLTHSELQCDGRTRLLLDAATALNNLLDRLKQGVPSVVKEAKAAVAPKRVPRIVAHLAAPKGSDEEEDDEEGDGDDDGAASVASFLEGGDKNDGIRGELGKVVPRKIETCEIVYDQILEMLNASGASLRSNNNNSSHLNNHPSRGGEPAMAPASSSSSTLASSQSVGRIRPSSAARAQQQQQQQQQHLPPPATPAPAAAADREGAKLPPSPAFTDPGPAHTAAGETPPAVPPAAFRPPPPLPPSASAPTVGAPISAVRSLKLGESSPAAAAMAEEEEGEEDAEGEETSTADEACVHLKNKKARKLTPSEIRMQKRGSGPSALAGLPHGAGESGSGWEFNRTEQKQRAADLVTQGIEQKEYAKKEAERMMLEARKSQSAKRLGL